MTMEDAQTCFELCKKVLDQYSVGVEELDKRRQELSEAYSKGLRVDYTSDLTHCAYIRSDVTFHAFALSRIIRRSYELWKLFQSQDLTIASIGCGPGSDMIGVLRYVAERTNHRPSLRFALYDAVSEWEKAVNHFQNIIRPQPTKQPQPKTQSQPEPELKLSSEQQEQELGKDHPYRILPPCFEKIFYPWNLTSIPDEFIDYPSFKRADLFIFSMIFSDICRQSSIEEMENVKTNLEQLCQCAKIGSFFLIIDVNQDPNPWPSSNSKSNFNMNQNQSPNKRRDVPGFPLNVFLQGTVFNSKNPSLNFKLEQLSNNIDCYQLDPSEEKRDLGPYYSAEGRIKLQGILHSVVYGKIEPKVQVQVANKNPLVQKLEF